MTGVPIAASTAPDRRTLGAGSTRPSPAADSELVSDERLGTEPIGAHEEDALFPHRHLAPMRELVWELRDLAAQGDVSVPLAVHPFCLTAIEDIQHRLLEDY